MRTLLHTGRMRLAAAALLPILAGPLGLAGRATAQCPPVWTSVSPATAPVARYGHAMAYDSRRGVTVLVGGGDNPNSPTGLSDTWEWNGATWTQRASFAAPPGRLYCAMAYDSTRGVSVLFGGISVAAGGLVADTWEWDGTNWTQRTPATSPSARYGHAMVFDSARGVTVLFGGNPFFYGGSGSPLNDTWEWNGTNWTQRTPATAAPGRYFHAMAYDSVRHVTVVFGGGGSIPAYGLPPPLGDTWEWNGTNWAARTPAAAPSARFYHTMAYGTQGTTVLFGGWSASMNDTWEWNGANWTQPTLPLSPPPRVVSAMAYDSARGAMVLFGGAIISGSSASLYNDTWELQDTFHLIVQQPVNTIAIEGFAAMLGVATQGSFQFTYQWRKNGVPISGANMPLCVIPSCCQADAGVYDVVVTTGTCEAISDPATLSVRARADLNNDGDVDCRDLAMFIGDWTGPGTPPAPCAILGDLDCDGDVNFDDLSAFVAALVGQAAYEAKYPDCPWLNGDIDGDGRVTFDDINPFVACLVEGRCP